MSVSVSNVKFYPIITFLSLTTICNTWPPICWNNRNPWLSSHYAVLWYNCRTFKYPFFDNSSPWARVFPVSNYPIGDLSIGDTLNRSVLNSCTTVVGWYSFSSLTFSSHCRIIASKDHYHKKKKIIFKTSISTHLLNPITYCIFHLYRFPMTHWLPGDWFFNT